MRSHAEDGYAVFVARELADGALAGMLSAVPVSIY
jgi:hypothetical protein